MYIDEEDTILYAAAGIPYIKYNTLAPWTVLTSLANYSTNINIIIASNDSIIYACEALQMLYLNQLTRD